MGMIPYYLMLLIILICAYHFKENMPKQQKKVILTISLLPMFCLLAFKAESIGTDTANYINMFKDSGAYLKIDQESRIELGYQYLVLFLNKYFGAHQFLFIFSAFFICFSLYKFIIRTATNYALALFFFTTLGFFQFSISGIRQALAIAISLFAFKYIQERKLIKYTTIVALATLFHKSALFCLPIYWIMNMKTSTKNMIIMVIGIFSAYLLAEPFLLTAADVMNYNYGIESTNTGFIFMFIVLLITVACYKHRQELQGHNISSRFLINANYISLLLWVIRLVSRTAERLSLFVMPYTYISLEQYLTTRPSNKKSIYTIVAVLVAGYLFVHRMSPSEYLNNYLFFWQQ